MELPQESLAVVNTVVVPTGKVLPLGGLAVTNGGGSAATAGVDVEEDRSAAGLVATVVMFDGQAMMTG